MNPFFNKNYGPMNNSPLGNMMEMMNQFNQFKQNFQGDPREKVQQLLNSGQMSQEQLTQLQNTARQLRSMGFFK